MSNISQRFDTFLTRSNLSPDHFEDARTKYDGVCTKLHSNYYPNKYDGSTKILVGSYGKQTAIAPPTDIDVLFILPAEKYRQYSSYSSNGQSRLLQDVKNILRERYPSTEIRGDGQIVQVNFLTYKVEVLPGFNQGNNIYIVPDTHGGGKWKQCNPLREKETLELSNKRSNGNTINLIKLLKSWKYNCNVPIKSFVLELHSVLFLYLWEHYNKSSMYYDWMMRDFFKHLLTFKNFPREVPGTSERVNYGNAWESKVTTALAISESACKYESEKNYTMSSYKWREIFGERFPY